MRGSSPVPLPKRRGNRPVAPAPAPPEAPPNAPRARAAAPQSAEVESALESVAADRLLSESEILALGEALGGLMTTPGWQMVETLLTRMQNHYAIQGIRDPEQSKDYVRGKLDFIDEFRVALLSYVAGAEEVAARGDRPSQGDARVVSAMLPGGRRRL